jgi:outer membrane biosynthesis protein TonB
MQLGKAPVRLKSSQPADSPQYISFTAGAPEEQVEVYLDDLELVDGPAAAPAVPEPPVAPKTTPATPEREAPVAPPPKKKVEAQEKEPPVAPQPKKAAPDDKGADALHQAM